MSTQQIFKKKEAIYFHFVKILVTKMFTFEQPASTARGVQRVRIIGEEADGQNAPGSAGALKSTNNIIYNFFFNQSSQFNFAVHREWPMHRRDRRWKFCRASA